MTQYWLVSAMVRNFAWPESRQFEWGFKSPDKELHVA